MEARAKALIGKIGHSPQFPQLLNNCVCNTINFDLKIPYTSGDLNLSPDELCDICEFTMTKYQAWIQNHNAINTKELFFNDDAIINDRFKACFEIWQSDIKAWLNKSHLVKYYLEQQRNYLVAENYDWRLKSVMGSSKLSILRVPLVQLDFIICSGSDQYRTVINCELNAAQVRLLIEQLEQSLRK